MVLHIVMNSSVVLVVLLALTFDFAPDTMIVLVHFQLLDIEVFFVILVFVLLMTVEVDLRPVATPLGLIFTLVLVKVFDLLLLILFIKAK